MVDLKGLNREQREAVECVSGPLLVLAGAGSGKTRVITYRVAHLLALGASSSEILALSFTNKAANEMRERVQALVGERGRGCILSTFHALGLRFLRQEFAAAGLHKNFTVLDEADQVDAVRQVLEGAGYDIKQYEPKLVHGRIGAFKSRLQRPDGRRGGLDGVVAHTAPLYGRRLRALNAVDFDDLIAVPVWLMRSNPDLGYAWAGRYKHIMVDEYQDTNLGQLGFLEALAGRATSICVVGDDDQSIYGWRGAEAGNILGFSSHFKGAKTIALVQNYRSCNHILRASNALIANNTDRHEKTLWSDLGDGPKLRYVESDDGDIEAHFIATDLLGQKREGRSKWAHCAVLYRTNAQSRALEEAIRGAGVPYRVVGGSRFYDRKEVRDLVAYLRVIANPYDETALRRIINYPPRGIGDQTIHRISDYAQAHETPFWRVVEHIERVPDIPERGRNALQAFGEMLRTFRARSARNTGPLGGLCRDLVERVGFRNALTKVERDAMRVRRRLDHLDEVASGIDAYQRRHPDAGLDEYLSALALDARKEEEDETESDEVSLMTLHSAKGLEFDVVYVAGWEEGFLPHSRNAAGSPGEGIDLSEERRLAYVGMTRAKRVLTLTCARKRLRFGKTLQRKPSRFLFEIPEDLFQGGRTGRAEELTGEALQAKGLAAFAQMSDLIRGNHP